MTKNIINGMALLPLSMAFVACSQNEVAFDENYAYNEKAASYQKQFVDKFGAIAENHDWGFGQTTAGTRGSVLTETWGEAIGFQIPESITRWTEGKCANNCAEAFESGDGVDIENLVTDIDFDCYWLQHFNKAEGNHSEMVQLQAYDANAKNGTGAWVDVINFSNGQNETVTNYPANSSTKGSTLMINMGGKTGDPTQGPSYHKLFRWIDTDGNYHYNYKFLNYYFKQNKNFIFNELVLGICFDDEEAAPNGARRGNGKGNGNGNGNGNGAKGNWWLIVIKQATPIDSQNPVIEEGRIMCEDLGDKNHSDFDFNDVVFDAKRYLDGTITIEVKAAGGTLPISIAGESVNLGKMMNTGVAFAEKTQIITLQPTANGPAYRSIRDIPVVVNPGGTAQPYELQTVNGKAPQKICTPINTNWAEEYIPIDEAYSKFGEWVNNNDSQKWLEVEDIELTDLNLDTPIK